MASAVSDCKEKCIHYWVCKNREQYEQVIANVCKNREQYEQVIAKDVKLELELPDYIQSITEVSLLCKNQIVPEYGNSYPKYLTIRDCHRCVHQGLCKYQEEYNKLCESLKNVTVPFSLECPLHKEKTKESE